MSTMERLASDVQLNVNSFTELSINHKWIIIVRLSGRKHFLYAPQFAIICFPYKSYQIQKVAKNVYVGHHNLLQTAFGAFLCPTRALCEHYIVRNKKATNSFCS